MDSMRSLNTSLPGTSPSKNQASEPPEQLLQAFKAAALSVTKLYKTAAADQGRARSEGYQDALDDLLSFLDKENIGLSDGEGWRIRRWATERLDGRDSVPTESDDEIVEKLPVERASSPVIQRSSSVTRAANPTTRTTRTASPVQMEPAPPTIPEGSNHEHVMNTVPPQGNFTFRSSHAYPQDADMGLSDLDLSDHSRGPGHDSTPHAVNSTPGITITRPSRGNLRHNNTSRNTRSSGTIGRGAGQKRKINLGDFFDIGNLGPKDGFGGGGNAKRGRYA